MHSYAGLNHHLRTKSCSLLAFITGDFTSIAVLIDHDCILILRWRKLATWAYIGILMHWAGNSMRASHTACITEPHLHLLWYIQHIIIKMLIKSYII